MPDDRTRRPPSAAARRTSSRTHGSGTAGRAPAPAGRPAATGAAPSRLFIIGSLLVVGGWRRRSGRDGGADRASACSAARASTHSRSASRFRYGSKWGPGINPSDPSVTARRSARRTIVRASSSAALVGGLARDDELASASSMWRLGLAEHRLEALDHRRDDARHAVLVAIPRVRRGRQLGGRDEQLALEPEDDRGQLAEPDGQRRRADP